MRFRNEITRNSRLGILILWVFLCLYALIKAFIFRKWISLFLIPLPIFLFFGIWLALYFFVLVHEAGHCLAGIFLRFPVCGIEVGPFPHRVFKINKFSFRLGKFPLGGKTILGFTPRTLTRFEQFWFLSGGTLLELFLFGFLFYFFHGLPSKICVLVFYLDQLLMNLFPRYEQGRAANDGASLLEVFLPKNAIKKQF